MVHISSSQTCRLMTPLIKLRISFFLDKNKENKIVLDNLEIFML